LYFDRMARRITGRSGAGVNTGLPHHPNQPLPEGA